MTFESYLIWISNRPKPLKSDKQTNQPIELDNQY